MQPVVDKFLERNSIVLPKLAVPEEEPPQSVLLVGSAILAAYNGREAEFSVYHLSPMRLHRAKNASLVAIDPVVRIELPTALMIAIIFGLREIVPSLPASEEQADA